MVTRCAIRGRVLIGCAFAIAQLVSPILTSAALGQTVERSIQRVVEDWGQTFPQSEQKIALGIGAFQDAATGASCGPLAEFLREKVVQSLQRGKNPPSVILNSNLSDINYVLWGKWTAVRDLELVLDLMLVAIKESGNVADQISMTSVRLEVDALPSEVRPCLMRFSQMSESWQALRDLPVYTAPYDAAKIVMTLPPKAKINVTGRNASTNWYVVDLPEDRNMPVGYRNTRGYVYLGRDIESLVTKQRTHDQTVRWSVSVEFRGNASSLGDLQRHDLQNTFCAHLGGAGFPCTELAADVKDASSKAVPSSGGVGIIQVVIEAQIAEGAGGIFSGTVKISGQTAASPHGRRVSFNTVSGRVLGPNTFAAISTFLDKNLNKFVQQVTVALSRVELEEK